MTSQENKTKMESLVKKREKYFARLQTLYDVGKKCFDLIKKKDPYNAELDSFISRYQRLEEDYLIYENICEQINDLNSRIEKEDKVETHNASLAYDEMYFNVQTLARKFNVDKKKQSADGDSGGNPTPPVTTQPQIARLPKLEIEPFDGSISAWPNFYALFNSMIHKNKSLSNSEKLTYLRSLLKSHALALIETLVICDENYAIAMQILVQRYQNKRLLASNYLDKVFSLGPLNEDSISSLSRFLEVFNTNLSALKALDIPDLFDFTMLHRGLHVLTPSARKDFENEYASTEIPQFENLISFVQQQLKIMEITAKSKTKLSKPLSSYKPIYSKSSMLSTVNNQQAPSTTKKPMLCPCCQSSDHKIYSCIKFKSFPMHQRYEFTKNNSLCFCCLGFHKISDCNSTSKCTTCNGRHHSLLHRAKEPSLTSTPANLTSQSKPTAHDTTKSCHFANANSSSNMMLSTAIIGIQDQHNKLQPIRAIIDGGSQTSLITQECVKRLGIQPHPSNVTIRALADTNVPIQKGSVKCSISPLKNNTVILTTEAIVVTKISTNQPNMFVDPSIMSKFMHLQLADPSFHESSPVEFLLGSDLYFDIIQESHNIIKGEPSAMATIFGWIIGGRVPTISPNQERSYFLNCCESVDTTLKRFWEVESVQIEKPISSEDIFVEKHFLETHNRDDSGRYTVCLPVKPEAPSLPNTRDQAKNRLISLEKRLKLQPETYQEYRSFMDEYISSGHMSIAHTPSPYVIPHHCVKNENSSTTKLRTVFNASYKPSSSSTSLNDILYSGPKLQKDIGVIITNFRLHEVVICADVKQMYRNVVVAPEHRNLQHIFYRTLSNGNIEEYELNVLTYGVTSSAFLAQRVLLQLVKDEGEKYPLASNAIIEQTFVDDICTSVDTPEEAVTLQNELIRLLSLGGFPLRKWASNCPKVLDSIPHDFREHPLVLKSEDDHVMKILGLQYDPNKDVFSYSVKLNPLVPTKRSMLSEIAKIYDVLGWITPVTFYAKNLMQRLWLTGLAWDDPLPQEMHEKWMVFISTLPSLSTLQIPRFTPIISATLVQLIGFCDASEKGYAASIYLRTEHTDQIKVFLVKAKSKVAPIKTMSIPRLELSAAQLLMEIVTTSEHMSRSIEPQHIILFSDSTIVLSWLSTPPYKLKTFVANRVVNIVEGTTPSQWRHVTSKENPCDCASRGLLPEDLVNCELWWKGPNFLYTPYNSWKSSNFQKEVTTTLPEVKVESLFISCESQTSVILEIMNNFSSLMKVQFIVAFVLRFIFNTRCKKKGQERRKGPISPQETSQALQLCIRATQQCHLRKDISDMKQGKLCSQKYRSLAPFLDENNLVRVGGRLKHSKLSESRKYPLLIPRSSRLATLICDHYHFLALHSGPRLTQSLLQSKFWITGVRQLLRERIFKCQKCYMFQAKPVTPKMADLPPIRFENVRAFLNVGLDYAGPMEFKESDRRKAPRSKGYIVIFVCLSTKAVHLEFATSLSTPSFLAALDRFVARRGLCKSIYSDCGTNFQGAANHFKQIQQFLKDANEEIAHHLTSKEIKWNFIPPAAPHFGGIWEAAVKSAKKHLVRVIGQLVLTYEEMSTLLTRIEAVLNSRPIGLMTTDPNDGDYLSPGHFLIGAPLLSPPEVDYTSTKMNRLTRFQLLQQATQSFWKSWSQDYLQTLMPRNKWSSPQPNVQKGDVVYLQIKNTSPLEWPIGRIEETYPGRDGTVRAAKIRTSQGTYVRPAHKLVPLPPSDSLP